MGKLAEAARRMNRIVVTACVLASAAGAAAGAAVANSPTRIEASLGFDGHFVPDRWAPLWIRSEGAPASARIAVVRLTADGRDIGRETFPAGEGQRFECPVLIALDLETIAVRLLSGDRVLAELKLDARTKAFPGHMALACGLPVRARLGISSALMPYEPLQAVAVVLGDLPSNGLDYDGVSALALADPGPALSPAQREALLAWIAGGGRLVLSSARPGREGLLGSLGLAASAESAADAGAAGGESRAADGTFLPFGLGGIVRITRDLSDVGAAEGGGFWKRAFALAPYGRAPRLSAAALVSAASASSASASSADQSTSPAQRGTAGGHSGVTAGARTALLVGLVVWFLVILAAASFGRTRKASSGEPRAKRTRANAARELRATPIVLASFFSLAIVIASIGALDAAFMRGSSVRALALVMPGSSAAIVSASLIKEASEPLFTWMNVSARRAIEVSDAEGEKGMFRLKPNGSDPWTHATATAAFSLATSGPEGITLVAVVGPQSLAGSSFPSLAFGSSPRGGERPPELDSTGPMAFLSETSTWWEKSPTGAWSKVDDAPSWLKPELPWVNGLRAVGARSGAASFLIGAGAAPSLGLNIVGGAPRKLVWALPLSSGPLATRPTAEGGA